MTDTESRVAELEARIATLEHQLAVVMDVMARAQQQAEARIAATAACVEEFNAAMKRIACCLATVEGASATTH